MRSLERDDAIGEEAQRLRLLPSWAAWWAELSNFEQFDGIGTKRVNSLFEAYRRLATHRDCVDPGSSGREEQSVIARLSLVELDLIQHGDQPRYGSKVIRAAHDLTMRIRSLLAEDSPLVSISRAEKAVTFSLRDGILVEQGWSSNVVVPPLFALWTLLRADTKFPIRSCQHCGRFFARVGGQIFCGKLCKERARDARRSGTPSRKATQERASREYRKNLNGRFASESRARASAMTGRKRLRTEGGLPVSGRRAIKHPPGAQPKG